MLKIIDLDIDEFLTGDTRIDSIALVEKPAIETDFIYFNKDKCSCDIGHNQDEEDIIDDMMELEDMLESGYEIVEVNDVDEEEILSQFKEGFKKQTEQEFYRIASKPNLPSILDSAFRRRRYVYAVGPFGGSDVIETSRDFCRRMFGRKQLVFRLEDIQLLSAQLNAEDRNRRIIPRPKGASVDLFLYKGGANCRHRWVEIQLQERGRILNDKEKTATRNTPQLDAPAQAGQVNPPPLYGRTRNEETVEQESESNQTFSKNVIFPIGFIKGMPIYKYKEDAISYSEEFGCDGKFEEVEYLGETGYVPCGYEKDENVQEFSFKLNEEKRMLFSPAMIPDRLIPRVDENGEIYYVRFSKQSIERAAYKFMMEKRITDTNLEHTDKTFNEVYLVESWIIQSENDKAYQLGFNKDDVPVGTWMVGYKVLDDDVWENYIKKGKVKGLSVEGLFEMGEDSYKSQDEFIYNQIIEILKRVEE